MRAWCRSIVCVRFVDMWTFRHVCTCTYYVWCSWSLGSSQHVRLRSCPPIAWGWCDVFAHNEKQKQGHHLQGIPDISQIDHFMAVVWIEDNWRDSRGSIVGNNSMGWSQIPAWMDYSPWFMMWSIYYYYLRRVASTCLLVICAMCQCVWPRGVYLLRLWVLCVCGVCVLIGHTHAFLCVLMRLSVCLCHCMCAFAIFIFNNSVGGCTRPSHVGCSGCACVHTSMSARKRTVDMKSLYSYCLLRAYY